MNYSRADRAKPRTKASQAEPSQPSQPSQAMSGRAVPSQTIASSPASPAQSSPGKPTSQPTSSGQPGQPQSSKPSKQCNPNKPAFVCAGSGKIWHTRAFACRGPRNHGIRTRLRARYARVCVRGVSESSQGTSAKGAKGSQPRDLSQGISAKDFSQGRDLS